VFPKSTLKIVLIAVFTIFSTPEVNASEQNSELTVMSRNLYLGSDVAVAMKLIPNMSKAAQFMWDQVAATDFKKRAKVLANEITQNKPEVIGIQEATRWYCKQYFWSKNEVIYDFTQDLINALNDVGEQYEIAQLIQNGKISLARNPGYQIPAIPFITMVSDAKSFQPVFGKDSAACGFEIADVLLIKKSISTKVLAIGNTEYEASYSIIPKLMTVYRGYTWIDLNWNGTTTRIISTHLESIWDEGKIPNAAIQAKQLVNDLATTKIPTIIIGDFNSDPRDPRAKNSPNPGEQPVESKQCPAQNNISDFNLADSTCSAYWTMRKAGFTDVGPDATDPKNFSWGMSALLAGPEIERFKSALQMGNKYGFTDRLDYIFTRGNIETKQTKLIGNSWPSEDSWQCETTQQKNNFNKVSEFANLPTQKFTQCFPTDHAGVIAKLLIPRNQAGTADALDAHAPFPISFWNWVGIILLAFLVFLIYRRKTR
jgi:endonuclease/exonuclease/phosphatase family metal-dependent hydrolase